MVIQDQLTFMVHNGQTKVLQPTGAAQQIAAHTGIGRKVHGALDFDIECLKNDPVLVGFETAGNGSKRPSCSRFHIQSQPFGQDALKKAVARSGVDFRGETHKPIVGMPLDRNRNAGLAGVVGVGIRVTENQRLMQNLPAPDFWQAIIRLHVDKKGVRDARSILFGKHLLGVGTMRDQAVAVNGDPLAGVVVAVFVNPLHFGVPGVVAFYLASALDRRLGFRGHLGPQLGL
jgi:hypothetical protein